MIIRLTQFQLLLQLPTWTELGKISFILKNKNCIVQCGSCPYHNFVKKIDANKGNRKDQFNLMPTQLVHEIEKSKPYFFHILILQTIKYSRECGWPRRPWLNAGRKKRKRAKKITFLAQAVCVRHACLRAPCVAWPLLSPTFALSFFFFFFWVFLDFLRPAFSHGRLGHPQSLEYLNTSHLLREGVKKKINYLGGIFHRASSPLSPFGGK